MSRGAAVRTLMLAAALAGVAAAPAAAAPAWLAPEEIGQADVSVSFPRVSFDPQGNAVAVWGQKDSYWRIWSASRPAGGTWSAPEQLSATGEDAVEPDVAVDEDGDAIAVWDLSGGVEVAERPLGGEWSEPIEIDDMGSSPRVDAGGDGAAAIAWQNDGVYTITRRTHGEEWTKPHEHTEPPEYARDPDVALRADGTALAIWHRSDETDVVRGSSQGADGEWTPPVTLSDGIQDARRPVLAAGGSSAIVAWSQHTGRSESIVSRRLSSSGVPGTVVPVSDDFQPSTEPKVAMNAAGEAVIAWRTGERIVRARTQAPDGTLSPSATLSPPSEASAGFAHAAMSEDGEALVAWSSGFDGQASVRPRDDTWSPARDVAAGTVTAVAWDGEGNAVAVGIREETFRVFAAGYDGAPPRFDSVSGPGTAVAGEPSAPFAATATDVWSPLTLAWDFGDGTPPAPGGDVSHVFGAAGRYDAVVTATDAVGNSASAPVGAVDVAAPPAPAPPPGPVSTTPGDGAPPPDRTPPGLTLRVGKSRLGTVLKRGLKVRATCGESCALTAGLTRRRTTVSRGSARMAKAGGRSLVLRLSARARKQLVNTRRVRLALTVEAVDQAGNKTRRTVAVTLRR